MKRLSLMIALGLMTTPAWADNYEQTQQDQDNVRASEQNLQEQEQHLQIDEHNGNSAAAAQDRANIQSDRNNTINAKQQLDQQMETDRKDDTVAGHHAGQHHYDKHDDGHNDH